MYVTNKFSIQIQLKENFSVQRFSVVGITSPPSPKKVIEIGRLIQHKSEIN